jgi:hypothetical protein
MGVDFSIQFQIFIFIERGKWVVHHFPKVIIRVSKNGDFTRLFPAVFLLTISKGAEFMIYSVYKF